MKSKHSAQHENLLELFSDRLLAEDAEAAAQELKLDYELEKITDINQIMAFGVLMTPALAVDGEVKAVGKVPTIDEIKGILELR